MDRSEMLNRWSLSSLQVHPLHNGEVLSTATGFVVAANETFYLVTNRHVVTGRHQDTGELLDPGGAFPQAIQIQHHSCRNDAPLTRIEQLFDSDIEPLWSEHGSLGKLVDVVALPLRNADDILHSPHDPWETVPGLHLLVAGDVSIIGFPYGRSTEGLPIWSRGAVASEPTVGADGLPRFYVDSRTRSGQSGSPVIIYKSDVVVRTPEQGITFMNDAAQFVGVYSGRIDAQSDLGYVWRADVLRDILATGRRPTFSAVHLDGA